MGVLNRVSAGGCVLLSCVAAQAGRTVDIDPVGASGPAGWNNIRFATALATRHIAAAW